MAFLDESSIFNAYINLANNDDLNPHLHLYQSEIIVIFKTNNSIGASRAILQTNFLQSYIL